MMIPPIGHHESRPALVRSHTPTSRSSETPAPRETAEISKSEASAPGPQRSSQELIPWRHNYENQLGLSAHALSLRTKALKEGGPEMLYRTYPLLFQQDLNGPYQSLAQLLPQKGPQIALAGDCHLGNFGTLRHENREVVWGVNDYDQVGKGGPESDLCRAGASLVQLCRQHDWGKGVAEDLIETFTHQYSKHIQEYCQTPPPSVLGITRSEAQEPVHALIKKAERQTQEDLLSKWTEMGSQGNLKFKLGEDLHKLDESQNHRLEGLLSEIRLPANVKVLDRCCRWDAGGSSLGLERYYLLAQKEGESLPVLLEIKQVLPCALATSDPDPKKCDPQLLQDGYKWLGAPKDQWQRVVRGDNGVYLMRERQRARDSLKTEKLSSDEAHKLAKQLARVLAQAHANGANPVQVRDWIDGREKLLSQNLLSFSSSYAAQMDQDFQTLFK
ncbi:MAG: DUF2252 family protein [Candidatus Eremiobacteraeota bacterium]|nr:DUF2252 family protein [Candidatus Eremiobacteraeota bacterium]